MTYISRGEEEAEAGVRGSPRPEPLLGFLQENLEKAQ